MIGQYLTRLGNFLVVCFIWVRFSDVCVIFFFQAEDGIRDGRVTGVQTCALPILGSSSRAERTCSGVMRCPSAQVAANASSPREIGRASCRKECRSRWSPYH